MSIGDNYYKSSDYCWEGVCSTHISSNTGLIVEGNVGIGTTNTRSFKLYVNGKARTDTPLASDSDDTVATKGYVDARSLIVYHRRGGSIGAWHNCNGCRSVSCQAGEVLVGCQLAKLFPSNPSLDNYNDVYFIEDDRATGYNEISVYTYPVLSPTKCYLHLAWSEWNQLRSDLRSANVHVAPVAICMKIR